VRDSHPYKRINVRVIGVPILSWRSGDKRSQMIQHPLGLVLTGPVTKCRNGLMR
jgi:hypothetical protein